MRFLSELFRSCEHDAKPSALPAALKKLDAFELEPRVLYSASPIPAELLEPTPDLDADAMVLDHVDSDFLPSDASYWNGHERETEFNTELVDLSSLNNLDSDTETNQVVIVDASADELDGIVEDIKFTHPNTKILIVDSSRDGIEQVTDFLSQQQDVSAIHIVSHGTHGSFNLGSTTVSDRSIESYAGEIAQWRDHLSAEADILFYGCNLTGTNSGELLMESFAELTGADIAASDDLTGHDSIGGDWDLEYQLGFVDTGIILSEEFQQAWISVLMDTPPTITVVGSSTSTNGQEYSLDVSVSEPDSNAISEWTVVWGDGNTSRFTAADLGTVTHTYNRSGLFDILVSVTDETGTYHNSTIVIPSQDSDNLQFFDQDGQPTSPLQSLGSPDVHGPEDIAMGPDGLLYVNSFHDGSIRAYDPDTGAEVHFIDDVHDGGAFGDANTGIEFDGAGNLYVANWETDEVYRYQPDGTPGGYTRDSTPYIDASRGLDAPVGIEFGPDGRLYISSWNGDEILAYEESTDTLSTFATHPDLQNPEYITFGEDGSLFVVVPSGSTGGIYKFNPDGSFDQRQISDPRLDEEIVGIEMGPDGRLYISNSDFGGAQNQTTIEVFSAIDLSWEETFIDSPAGDRNNLRYPGSVFFTPEVQVAVSNPTIGGVIIEDVDGDAQLETGAGENGIESVQVYLYSDNGDSIAGVGDSLVDQTTTDSNGEYSFSIVDSSLTYWVVVDSKTVSSKSTVNAGYSYETATAGINEGDVWAEQTYGDGGAKYGGLQAGVSDNANALSTSQHVSAVDLSAGSQSNVDFGFSFNVVTNLLAGDGQDDDSRDDGLVNKNDRSSQGSLRQFITNANAISGGNAMRFVPGVGSVNDGTDSWWRLDVSVGLPTIEDSNTVVDGRAYDANGRFNTNTTIHGQTVAVGTGADSLVGTGDEYILTGVEGVELEIRNDGSGVSGLTVDAANAEIAHLSIHGFGDALGGNIMVSTFGDNIYIHDNIIGSSANSFSVQTSIVDSVNGIAVRRADNGLVERNLIGFVNDAGIRIRGSDAANDGADNWTIRHNEIRANAQGSPGKDGVDHVRSADGVFSENLFAENSGFGLDTFRSEGNNLILNNTFTANGLGGNETGGVRLYGPNNEVRNNVFIQNEGAGVVVVGEVTTSLVVPASTGNEITRNSFLENTGISIDLVGSSVSSNIHDTGDGISENGVASNSLSGNAGFDHPDLDSVVLLQDDLNLSGTIDPTKSYDRLEVYVANPGAGDSSGGNSFGEGETYLGFIDGSTLSPDAMGRFDAVLSMPTGGWPVAITDGTEISLIAIEAVTNNTSEFGRTVAVQEMPDVIASTVTATEDQPYVFTVTDFQVLNDNYSLFTEFVIESLPAPGQLLLGGLPVANGSRVSFTQITNGELTFVAEPNANGNSYTSFDFSADGTHPSDSSVAMTIDVTPINDDPDAMDDSIVVSEDDSFTASIGTTDLLLNDLDVDGDSITVNTTPISGPTSGSLSLSSDGTFVYTPNPDFNGTDSFVYEVRDGNGGIDQATVHITVNAINDAPIAVDDSFSVDEDSTYSSIAGVSGLLFNDLDIDGDALSVDTSPVAGPTNGTLILNADGTFVYTPDADYWGNDSFTYEVQDGFGGTDRATVSIVVNSINDAPEVSNNNYEGLSTEVIRGQLLTDSSDVDGDMLSVVRVLSPPTLGTFAVMPDGTFEFTPDSAFSGTINVPVLVSDGNGGTNVSVVTLVVELPPTITSPTEPTPETPESPVEPLPIDPGTPEPSGPNVVPPKVATPIAIPVSTPPKNPGQPGPEDLTLEETTVDRSDRFRWMLDSGVNEPIETRSRTVKVAESTDLELKQLFASLDLFSESIDDAARKTEIGFSTSIISFSGISVGVVSWVLRASGMAASMLANIPAWRSIDPLIVLGYTEDEEDDTDESVTDIAEGSTIAESKPNHHSPSETPNGLPATTHEV